MKQNLYKNEVYKRKNDSEPMFNIMQDHLYKVIARLLKAEHKDNVLDVGCGIGGLVPYLGYTSYHGIDVSEPNINLCKEKYPELTFNVMESNDMKWKDHTFNSIICTEVLEHLSIDEIAQTLNEIKRVCKIGGTIVITTPNLFYLWGIIPWSLKPLRRRLTLNDLKKGYHNGWVYEDYNVPHKRFEPKYLKRLLENYFIVEGYTTSFWYNNRALHGSFTEMQKLIHKVSWLGNTNMGNNIIAVLKNNKGETI